jgi:GNAT superfamily N-acetyltransferase
VLVDPESPTPSRILGFFTLTACEAIATELPSNLAKRLPRNIPAVLLGRLAVDQTLQGQGYGKALLIDAIRKVAQTAAHIGIVGLFVDAKDEPAATYYRKFGFVSLPSNPWRLFLPLDSLQQIASES